MYIRMEKLDDDVALVVASHGRDEEDSLERALRSSVPYVGLVASRRRGPAVLEKLREVALHDREATFTLLVPAKPAGRSLTWTEGQSIAAARRTASEASRWLDRAGLQVDETLTGDASPVQAIADILVKRGPFSGIIISTQPRRISR